MSCKQAQAEMLPITTYELRNIHIVEYDINPVITPRHEVEDVKCKEFSFQYCVSFRDPNLPEWILARWRWNDKWIWTPDWIFPA